MGVRLAGERVAGTATACATVPLNHRSLEVRSRRRQSFTGGLCVCTFAPSDRRCSRNSSRWQSVLAAAFPAIAAAIAHLANAECHLFHRQSHPPHDPGTREVEDMSMEDAMSKYGELRGRIELVELEKGPTGLGLSLAGNKDRTKMSVFVCGLHPKGSAFSDGRIRGTTLSFA